MTAIEKVQGQRVLTERELRLIDDLYSTLLSSHESLKTDLQNFPFGRSLNAVGRVIGRPAIPSDLYPQIGPDADRRNGEVDLHETIELNGKALPRLFTGLWQLSSPSWGVASRSEIFDQFSQYVRRGFTAYDMADHYGDAEVLFVSLYFRLLEFLTSNSISLGRVSSFEFQSSGTVRVYQTLRLSAR
jgi:hypothetical protein